MHLPALLALLALARPALSLPGGPLLPSDTYTLQYGRDSLVITRSAWLGGTPLLAGNSSGFPADTAEGCIRLCALNTDCDWSNWCPTQVPCGSSTAGTKEGPAAAAAATPTSCLRCPPSQAGCDDGFGPLPFQACRMLSGQSPDGCTLSPPVIGRLAGEPQDTGGKAEQQGWQGQGNVAAWD